MPGVTNKILGKKAAAICVAYNNLENYFPKEKIVKTGNPIREAVLKPLPNKQAACQQFNLDASKPVILILGGSLGARAINRAVAEQLDKISENAQLIWQCGKLYIDEYSHLQRHNIWISAFIDDMNMAYAAADIIVSRAGAGTISELAIVGKPAILIPSPNVAEDHQTHNAKALSTEKAALLLPEANTQNLGKIVNQLLSDEAQQNTLRTNIKTFALPEATKNIVNQILNHIK